MPETARIILPAPPPALIETIRADPDGNVPLLRFHLARLRTSCDALGYPCELKRVRAAITAAAAATPGNPQRLRLLLHSDGTWTLQATPLPPLHHRLTVVIWPARLDAAQPLLHHKTTHRPWYTDATRWLEAHPHCFDALFFNQRGELCEGSRSNVFLRIGGRWLTPPLRSGCLPGTQRAQLLARGEVQEASLHAADLRRADGLRLSNGLRGWFDVALDDLRPIAGDQ